VTKKAVLKKGIICEVTRIIKNEENTQLRDVILLDEYSSLEVNQVGRQANLKFVTHNWKNQPH